MNYYQTKSSLNSGSSYDEVMKSAGKSFSIIKKRTKRQPYIRSVYFLKKKVFFNIFWKHIFDKTHSVRTPRLKYFDATIDLIKNSRNNPVTIDNQNIKSEVLHRFYGLTKERKKFVVQIKQIKRSGKLYLMSMYPV